MIAAESRFMLIARRYVIGGRVQGVGFRYFTQAEATREGVRGWCWHLLWVFRLAEETVHATRAAGQSSALTAPAGSEKAPQS
jgi:hypothetical protein